MTRAVQIACSAFAALSLGLIAQPPSADARSMSAASGSGINSVERDCFLVEPARTIVFHICTTQGQIDQFKIPLPVDTFSTSKSVSLTYQASGVGDVQCTVRAENRTQTTQVSSPTLTNAAASGAFQTFNFGAVTVPNNGHLTVHCFVKSNAALGTVNYNP
jgi:hypothetical protein